MKREDWLLAINYIKQFKERYGAAVLMQEFQIRGSNLDDDLMSLVSAIRDHFDMSVKILSVKLTDKRGLSANAIGHVWAKQVSEVTGEDVLTVFNRFKRDHGLPILLSDPVNGVVADYILKQTKFHSMSDEQQLKLIGAMEVTRTFSTRQHKEFRNSVQAFYNSNGFNLQYLEKD